ncbi:DUF3253 domain-containing protein [Lysobacter sp. N42]|uniref:DUF3253 domain-containing protein n=1 Tax=Lysobacter sp. N42 TaxID=2545719 RepID=UPI00105229B6|nr:DUF3253 domain-containing protein [Lysobacter sp. N42]TCZ81706.1 DUF3253 domain-containing protein [Lysobacter sp. N42]
MPDDRDIERAIVGLLSKRAPEASICPSEAARALGGDWRASMPRVRDVAASLARARRIRVTQGAREIAPDDVAHAEGPIRLRRGAGYDARLAD